MSQLAAVLQNWINAGLSFIYPEVCQVCDDARATPRKYFVCDRCLSKVRAVNAPFCSKCGLPFDGEMTVAFECRNCAEAGLRFDFARSAVKAGPQVLEVIHQYKYNRAFWFEGLLGKWLVDAAVPELEGEDWNCIVPVPLHPAKLREREFNQAEKLARHLSSASGIPLRATCLQRIRATKTQTMLDREERRKNMHRAFEVRKNHGLEGQNVVLVDDVMTTGATTSACAAALKAGGAGKVCVWTVARGI